MLPPADVTEVTHEFRFLFRAVNRGAWGIVIGCTPYMGRITTRKETSMNKLISTMVAAAFACTTGVALAQPKANEKAATPATPAAPAAAVKGEAGKSAAATPATPAAPAKAETKAETKTGMKADVKADTKAAPAAAPAKEEAKGKADAKKSEGKGKGEGKKDK
jgi:hypothetical protein